MVEYVFVYGTLQDSNVQKKIIGKIAKSKLGVLLGFKKTTIEINNNTYFIIEKDKNSDEEIQGLLLEIEEADLLKLDEYETNAYRREKVELKSGFIAWVYLK